MVKRNYEAALAELVNEEGEFYGRTLGAEWTRPSSVELRAGVLCIQSTRRDGSRSHSERLIKAPHGLLDRFVSLGETSVQANTLAPVRQSFTRSDEKIRDFAARYGGLQVFYRAGGKVQWPLMEHLEYCDVWRYFAGAVGALQRIAAAVYREGSGAKEDWKMIHQVPTAMKDTAHDSSPGFLSPYVLSDERNWLALAHFAGRDSQEKRSLLGHFVNTLLGLGDVRPWLTWPDTTRRAVRPQITYSSRSLLSQLALQLCLRLTKVDAFLVCIHCHKTYSPVVRAPRTGFRNFCPDCRAAGEPQRYAMQDFRKRRREESSSKGQ